MLNRSNESDLKQKNAAGEQQDVRVPLRALNWRRLLGYLKPYRGQMVLAIVALIFSTGFGLAFPAVIVQLLNTVTQAKNATPRWRPVASATAAKVGNVAATSAKTSWVLRRARYSA